MIIKCKICGGDIQFGPGATYGTCDYCGRTSTIPKADDESMLNRYNRANHFRRQGEFDKAVSAYEKILEQDDTDAEAHWGAVISRYGIEYVEDPATKERIPTCHRLQLTSILADEDYKDAVKYAPDAESLRIYEEEAARIAEIQKGILAISQNEKPYDVFICYKETDENGQRTHDSQWAQDIYYGLTEQGYKVFFSRITLEDKLGQEYEPYIFAALNSAKVMVVIGSKPEYFNAVWVKNEWRRYLALMAKDRKRLLIPCYRDMDPYDLPDELSSLQSQDMSRIGFMQDLIRGIRKMLEVEKKPEQPRVIQQVVQTAASGTDSPGVVSLMKRVYLFLEDGDFRQASEYIDRVLDIDPEYAPAYAAKVCAAFGIRKESGLAEATFQYEDNPDWQKALRFAAPDQRKIYEDYQAEVRERVNGQIRQYAFDCAVEMAVRSGVDRKKLESELAAYRKTCRWDAGRRSDGNRRENGKKYEVAFLQAVQENEPGDISEEQLKTAAEMFEAAGVDKASKCAEQCRILAEQARQKKIYNAAKADKLQGRSAVRLEEVAKGFLRVPEYKDASTLAQQCLDEAERIRDEAYSRIANRMKEAGTESAKWKEIVDRLSEEDLNGYRDVEQLKQEASRQYKKCIEDEEKVRQENAVKARKEAEAATARKKRNIIRAAVLAMVVVALFFVVTKVIVSAGNYRKAVALQQAGDYAGAFSIFNGIRGYKDVDSLLATDENLIAAAAEEEARLQSWKTVGSYVTFGTYPQTKAGKDVTPIEWLILDVQENKALLISRYALDCQPYNTEYKDITWEQCTLRTWLNSEFVNKAFSADEQKAILMTKVDNSNSQGCGDWDTTGGSNTQDQIFLLSYAEAWKYLADDASRKCGPTDYAVAQGGYTSPSHQVDGKATGWWWLRSPGRSQNDAACVYDDGSRSSHGVYGSSTVVRPAFWINLESDIF